jgi:hypothetical protein
MRVSTDFKPITIRIETRQELEFMMVTLGYAQTQIKDCANISNEDYAMLVDLNNNLRSLANGTRHLGTEFGGSENAMPRLKVAV